MPLRYALALLLTGLLPVGCKPGDHSHPETSSVDDMTEQEPAPSLRWFAEEAAARGIDFLHQSGHYERFLIPEIVAGGGAMLDIDQDGWMDLYFVQSGAVEDVAESRPPNRLYRNDGAGRFIDITKGSGADDRGYGLGAAVGDFDNDGYPDLYVTNLGPNRLLRNRGDLTFEDISERSGTDHSGFAASATFFDADRNGLLDLFVTNYLAWTPASERRCLDDRGRPDYCAPMSYNAPAADLLFRNLGNGRFEDVSRSSGIASRPGTGLGVACADFDGNGWLDVFVANDGMNDHLWMNQRNWTFTEEALRRGCAVDESGVPKAGMGVVIADFTGNGQPDILVCNLVRESDSLFRNEDGWFTDVTARFGIAAVSRQFTRFGIGAHDFDHDGHLDLFVANGRVARSGTLHGSDPYAEPNLLYRGAADGRFARADAEGGFSEHTPLTARAAIFGDIDNDLAIDIVVVHRDGPIHLLHNVADGAREHHAIMLRILDEHGRDALHARAVITFGPESDRRTITRFVRADSSYLAANDPRVHVGLGSEPRCRLRFPSLQDPHRDELLQITIW